MTDSFAGYEAITIAGIGAPRGTPQDIVERLNKEINAGLSDEGNRTRLDDLARRRSAVQRPTLRS